MNHTFFIGFRTSLSVLAPVQSRRWNRTPSRHQQTRTVALKPSCRIRHDGSSPGNKTIVLGIETSCDETGAAVVDYDGNVLGEGLHSQLQTHLNLGGIIPPIARDLHLENIATVVETALSSAKVSMAQVSAVAVTTRPGLGLSLAVGTNHAKGLCRKWNKPLIAVHHMEAHALTARMTRTVNFPFLVLLVSGGHCLLAIANNIEEFLLLGQSIDTAPGEVLDKGARRLKLKNLPALSQMSGGRALEEMAKQGNPRAFRFCPPMSLYRDCSFSFAGMKSVILTTARTEEEKHNVEGGQVLPLAVCRDLCASFQHSVFAHICKRLQRGMEYVDVKCLLPKESRTLVVSGGVACNGYLRQCLSIVCTQMGYNLVCPPPKLCTDNGIMIAWNGIEKLKAGVGIADDVDAVNIAPKAPFGSDISEDVRQSNISLRWIKLLNPKTNELNIQSQSKAHGL